MLGVLACAGHFRCVKEGVLDILRRFDLYAGGAGRQMSSKSEKKLEKITKKTKFQKVLKKQRPLFFEAPASRAES